MLENLRRLGTYAGVRGLLLFFTVIVAVWLIILIANMGGAMDKIIESQIREQVGAMMQNPDLQQLPEGERKKIYDQHVEVLRIQYGLDRPFIERAFRYLWNGITLNLGYAERIHSDTGSRQVRLILVERLPYTLLLWGTAQFLLFSTSVFIALILSRRYGSFVDRLVVMLAPTSAPPAWFYGIILILIFASLLKVLPYGGFIDPLAPPTFLGRALSVLKHMVLPVSSVIVGGIFATIYSWRTFFLIYSSEDYVELARAKGLSSRSIERRYILRPTLPPIVTSFAMMLIAVWMGGVITETVFSWPGLGRMLYNAIAQNDTPVIVGANVIYGYLLAMSVFVLDILYAALDPRVRIGAVGGQRL
jgi:peptide/nickel transport system permease protein